jgi:hypothetical protein
MDDKNVQNCQAELIQELFIPDQGACLPEKPEAEMLRVFSNFRYRVYNDGDDTFSENSRTEEVAKTKICDDAPKIAKSFFIRARLDYEDDEEELSLDYLDPIGDALVQWVFAKYLPELTPADAVERWKVVKVEQRARRKAAYAVWMKTQEEKNEEFRRMLAEQAEFNAAKHAVHEASKRKRAATLLAKKETKEAANRKRAATLLAKKQRI